MLKEEMVWLPETKHIVLQHWGVHCAVQLANSPVHCFGMICSKLMTYDSIKIEVNLSSVGKRNQISCIFLELV